MLRLSLLAGLFCITQFSIISHAQEVEKPFIPYAIGNSWTYEVFIYDAEGKRLSEGTSTERIRAVFETPQGKYFYLDSDEFGLWMRNTP